MCITTCPCHRCGDSQRFCNECPNRHAGPTGNTNLGSTPNTNQEG